MSDGVVFTSISGFEELNRKINALADDRNKVIEVRNILRKAAGATVKVAKQLAPVSKKVHVARGVRISPRNLQKSIGPITGKNKVNPTIYVGARVKGSYKGWYAHFVHDGVNTYSKGFKRKHKRGANDTVAVGRSKGNPFLQKAFAATGGLVSKESVSEVTKYFQKRINALSR